jgi:hypothetical protein
MHKGSILLPEASECILRVASSPKRQIVSVAEVLCPQDAVVFTCLAQVCGKQAKIPTILGTQRAPFWKCVRHVVFKAADFRWNDSGTRNSGVLWGNFVLVWLGAPAQHWFQTLNLSTARANEAAESACSSAYVV